METQANEMRMGGPVVMAQVKHGVNVDKISEHILAAWKHAIHT